MTSDIQTEPRFDPHLIYGADAAVSLTAAMALMLTAAPLTALIGWSLPPDFLFTLGALLVPWAVFNLWIARKARPAPGMVRANLAGDAVWVLGSILLVAVHATSLSPLGLAMLLGQAGAVAVVLAIKRLGLAALIG